MEKTDFIVVGSGIAGLRAAIELAEHGQVTVLTKSNADESNTEYAQGGVAVAMSDEDQIGLHYQDTILAGDGLCNEAAVQVLVEEGPARIQELIAWGTEFDREGGTRLAFTREAAHSRRRILHAGGDSTGREINRTLIQKVRSLPGAQLLPHSFGLELLISERGCQGIRYLDQQSGRVQELRAGAVLLTTGGIGTLYRETTNPDIATGDGYALAFRAGAALADMEFVQFHPTALKLPGAPHFLLSEALRGEGGRLLNRAGHAFMKEYHPSGDLAPRDVVARSLFREARGQGDSCAFLDLTHLDPSFVRRRFPRIHETCLTFGLEITRDWIPVFPAAHYMMGGVYTDLEGLTSLAGLFAAGEVACNGVHGANRLASNSLLEGLVFGWRAARAMLRSSDGAGVPRGEILSEEAWQASSPAGKCTDRSDLRALMSEQVGIVRTREGLLEALQQIRAAAAPEAPTRREREFSNLLVNARLVAGMALLREESRGAHYRTDFPDRNDRGWGFHLIARYNPGEDKVIFATLDWSNAESLPVGF